MVWCQPDLPIHGYISQVQILSNGQSLNGQNSIYGTLNNAVNVQRTATYIVTPSYGTCTGADAGASFTLTVFVNPTPSIANINTTICTGTSFSVTPAIGGSNIIPTGTLYSWGIPTPQNVSVTGGVASTFSSTNVFGGPLNNPTNTTYYMRYSVTPATSLCVGAAFNVDVYVDPKPAVTPMSTTICNGVFTVTPTPATNGVNGTVPVNTLFTWVYPMYPPHP